MNRQILVVEDEAPIREMITFVLEQNGFNAIEAETIEQAQAKIKEPYPDLILLDWMLPGGTGVKLAKSLKHMLVLSNTNNTSQLLYFFHF